MSTPVKESPSTELAVVTDAAENGERGRIVAPEWKGNKPIKLRQEQIQALADPVDPENVEIRPDDGLIYFSHVFVREKLNQVFGPAQWWMEELSTSVQGNWIYFKGRLVAAVGSAMWSAVAVGEAKYQASNARMSWASAWEAAKSDCIVRACKDLGIGKECWQPRWSENWKAQYAVKVERTNQKDGRRYHWRRRDARPFWDETNPPKQPAARPNPHDDDGDVVDAPPAKPEPKPKPELKPRPAPEYGWVDEYEKAILGATMESEVAMAEFNARGHFQRLGPEQIKPIEERLLKIKMAKEAKRKQFIVNELVSTYGEQAYAIACEGKALDSLTLQEVQQIAQRLKGEPW